MDNVLEIKNLKTVFDTFAGKVTALDGVSISLKNGETLGVVGESGSGKSVTMLSVLKLLPSNGHIESGEIYFAGRDIAQYSKGQIRKLRGKEIGIIFQDPMTSLNPVFTIGNQLIEVILKHNKITHTAAKSRALEMLQLVGIPDYEKRYKQYPHEFSGGMRQRVMIAMALACHPKLLIADEPTTALDVTVQAQIIDLMREIKKKINMSVILITHDLGLVADFCDRIIVMYGGRIVETGTTKEIFHNPKHPYTKGLLKSIPKLNLSKERLVPINGYPPDLINPPIGCSFADRCKYSMDICFQSKSEYFEISETQKSSCWLLHEFCKEELRCRQ